jgi:hypothetical protein
MDCQNAVIACHGPRPTNDLRITDCFFRSPDMSLVEKLSALVHESRHGERIYHVQCTAAADGALKATGQNCDESYETGGAYAVEAEFLARIALYGEGFSPSERAMARRQALFILNAYMNEPNPFGSHQTDDLTDAELSELLGKSKTDPQKQGHSR